MRLVEIPLDDSRWPAFLESSCTATVFHSPSWVRTLAESYGFRGFAIALVDEGGCLWALLPMAEVDLPLRRRRWISLPFTDVCPPLFEPGVDEVAVLAPLEQARVDAEVASVEVHAPVEGAAHRVRGVEHVLLLDPDPNELRRRFKKQTWQQVKQAERQGLRVRVATRAEDLVETYYRLHLATRRRQGVPSQPRRFFERLWVNVLEPGHGFLLLAEHQGTSAGGAVFLTGSPTLVYKYSASLPRLWGLRPNNLLLWTAMQRGIAHGCTHLHFGRSDTENQGLRAFKSGWGAEEGTLVYSTVGPEAHTTSLHPPGLSRAAAFAIRRSPQAVCRTLGETLYRFAA